MVGKTTAHGIDVCPKLAQVYSEWRMFVSPNMIRVDKSQEQRMIVDRGEFSEEILRSAFEDRDGSEANLEYVQKL